TKAALTKAGLWDALSAKCILAESVRQVLDYLARGEVDAGFVYGTDAKQGGDKVKVIAEVPVETPVSYPIAVLAGAKDKKDAAAFVTFVAGPKGQEILAKFGFKKP
ncbi:MAG: molybdate ABC transporter substrate-binding protein, partial [Acidobacteriota bacterium]